MAPFQVRPEVYREGQAYLDVGPLQSLVVLQQDSRDALIEQVEAATQLDEGTKHRRRETLARALLACPASGALERVLPEVDAVSQPIPTIGARLPGRNRQHAKQQVARERFRTAVIADDDSGELIHLAPALRCE